MVVADPEDAVLAPAVRAQRAPSRTESNPTRSRRRCNPRAPCPIGARCRYGPQRTHHWSRCSAARSRVALGIGGHARFRPGGSQVSSRRVLQSSGCAIRAAGLRRSRDGRSARVASDERARRLRDGNGRRHADAPLPRAADRGDRSAGGAALCVAAARARRDLRRRRVRALDESLGVGSGRAARLPARRSVRRSNDGLPTWTYALGDALLDVTLAMPPGPTRPPSRSRGTRARRTARDSRAPRRRRPRSPRRRAAGSRRLRGGAGRRRRDRRAAGVGAHPARLRTRRGLARGRIARSTRATSWRARPSAALTDVDDYLHVLTCAWELQPGADAGLVASLDPRVPARRAHDRTHATRRQRRAREDAADAAARPARARRRRVRRHPIATRRAAACRSSQAIRGSPTGGATR